MKNVEDAEHTWQALIQQNPDNYDYFKGYFSNQGLDLCKFLPRISCQLSGSNLRTVQVTEETRDKALQILREFSTQLPRAAAPRRLALGVATGKLPYHLNTWLLFTGIRGRVQATRRSVSHFRT